MAKANLKTVPKITVKIWKPILEKLESKLRAACLRRDAYLQRVLESELEHLDQEVAIPNSQASFEYVQRCLEALPRETVSLALPHELTGRLNEICQRKYIVRDAFFNRLFLLLAASPKSIDNLLFPYVDGNWREHVWSEYKHEGPFFQNGFYPLEPVIDPFWAIRTAFEIYAREAGLEDYVDPSTGLTVKVRRGLDGQILLPDGVYTAFLDQKTKEFDITGFNCHVPDWRIPDHPAQQAYQTKLDDILSPLESS